MKKKDDGNYPPRIGGTERTRPALKYANPRGECSNAMCDNLIRKAPAGWYGKYCNQCSRRLQDQGDLNTSVPKLKDKPIAIIYATTSDVVRQLLKERHKDTTGAAWGLERCIEWSDKSGMGDPVWALRNDNWMYHHYIHHKLKTLKQEPVEVLVHLMSVVGVTQLAPQYFATKDQEDLFLVKRGLGHGLPSIKVSKDGKHQRHGRWSLRRARVLAGKLRVDWKLGGNVQRLVAEEVLLRLR